MFRHAYQNSKQAGAQCPLGVEGEYLPLYKVAYTPFRVQGDDTSHIMWRKIIKTHVITIFYSSSNSFASNIYTDCAFYRMKIWKKSWTSPWLCQIWCALVYVRFPTGRIRHGTNVEYVVEVDTMLVQRRVSSGLSRIQNESLSFDYWRLLTYFIHCELWIAGAIPNSQWIKITQFNSKNMNVIIIWKGKLRASSFRWIMSLFY